MWGRLCRVICGGHEMAPAHRKDFNLNHKDVVIIQIFEAKSAQGWSRLLHCRTSGLWNAITCFPAPAAKWAGAVQAAGRSESLYFFQVEVRINCPSTPITAKRRLTAPMSRQGNNSGWMDPGRACKNVHGAAAPSVSSSFPPAQRPRTSPSGSRSCTIRSHPQIIHFPPDFLPLLS